MLSNDFQRSQQVVRVLDNDRDAMVYDLLRFLPRQRDLQKNLFHLEGLTQNDVVPLAPVLEILEFEMVASWQNRQQGRSHSRFRFCPAVCNQHHVE